MEACRRSGATLIIAKLDRLARNVHFAFAEHEAKRISERTREALLAAKRRGVKLGVCGPANLRQDLRKRKDQADAFAVKLKSTLYALRAAGMSQRAIAEELNRLGIKTVRGNEWSLVQVQRVLKRLAAPEPL
jgi:DNA invertase Pin-like site-specific DNA recombinase